MFDCLNFGNYKRLLYILANAGQLKLNWNKVKFQVMKRGVWKEEWSDEKWTVFWLTPLFSSLLSSTEGGRRQGSAKDGSQQRQAAGRGRRRRGEGRAHTRGQRLRVCLVDINKSPSLLWMHETCHYSPGFHWRVSMSHPANNAILGETLVTWVFWGAWKWVFSLNRKISVSALKSLYRSNPSL